MADSKNCPYGEKTEEELYEKERKNVEKFAYVASIEEIRDKNDYNCNVPRYVDTLEKEELIDISGTLEKIGYLAQKGETHAQMAIKNWHDSLFIDTNKCELVDDDITN